METPSNEDQVFESAAELFSLLSTPVRLRIISAGFLLFAYGLVLTQAFNGAGDTMTPTRINLVFFWLIQIPLAWLLALHFDWKELGVFWAVFVSETSVGLFTLWLFSRGKWKTVQV